MEAEEESRLKRELATKENNRRINKLFSLSYRRRPQASLLPTLNTGMRHPRNSQSPPQASLLPPTMARGTIIRVHVRDIVGSTFSNVGNNNSNGTLHLILSILPLIYFVLILSREQGCTSASAKRLLLYKFKKCFIKFKNILLQYNTIIIHDFPPSWE